MTTPLREGYYFGPSFNKKSSGLRRRSGHDDRRIAAEQVLVFREGVICIGRKYVASDARILMCIRRGCHCCAPPPRGTLIRRKGPPRSFAGTIELHLIYWNFCTLPRERESAQSSTQQQPAVSLYTRSEGSRSSDNSPARLRSSRKSMPR